MWQLNHSQWEHNKVWSRGKATLSHKKIFQDILLLLDITDDINVSHKVTVLMKLEDPSGIHLVQTPTQNWVCYNSFPWLYPFGFWKYHPRTETPQPLWTLLNFPAHQDEPFLILEKVILVNQTAVLDPSSQHPSTSWDSSKQVPLLNFGIEVITTFFFFFFPYFNHRFSQMHLLWQLQYFNTLQQIVQ